MATIIKLIQEALQENLETIVLMLIVVGSLSAINKIFGYKAILSCLILLILIIDISGLTFLFYKKT